MGAIDADAHVIETVQTWSYLAADERRFTPQLMTQTFGEELLSNEGITVHDFWVIEGRAFGKDRNVGTNTPQESREMLSVEARLAQQHRPGADPALRADAGRRHELAGGADAARRNARDRGQ